MTNKTKAGRPKGSTKAATLKRIFPVARKLFAEKGYAQTTFKDIGAALGMSHAALYTYFPDKKTMYLATVSETQALLLPHYQVARDTKGSVKTRLSVIFKAMAEAHDEDESITGLLASVPIEMRRHADLFEALLQQESEVLLILFQLFDDAKAAGEIDAAIPNESLVTAIFGAGIGVALYHYGTHQKGLTETMALFTRLLNSSLFNGSDF